MSVRRSIRIEAVCLVLCAVLMASAFAVPIIRKQQKFIAPDVDSNFDFGISVAVSNDLLVVGADYATGARSAPGAVYTYTGSGATWNFTQKIFGADGRAGDRFGKAVAISGDVVVVGAPFHKSARVPSGTAYIYTRIGDTLGLTLMISPSDGQSDDEFAGAVAILNDVIVIGAPLASFNGSRDGAAYVYTLIDGKWNETQKLVAYDRAAANAFGISVALSESVIMVGANSATGNVAMSGAVYAYNKNGGRYDFAQKIVAADGAADDGFGFSVALESKLLVVGAHKADRGGSVRGAAYIFKEMSGIWNETQILTGSGADAAEFGTSVAVKGNGIMVGADKEDGGGRAYIYEESGGVWTLAYGFSNISVSSRDYFGHAVALSDNAIIVGAHGDNDNATKSGAVYLFSNCASGLYYNGTLCVSCEEGMVPNQNQTICIEPVPVTTTGPSTDAASSLAFFLDLLF